jgi:hypothetical protein
VRVSATIFRVEEETSRRRRQVNRTTCGRFDLIQADIRLKKSMKEIMEEWPSSVRGLGDNQWE